MEDDTRPPVILFCSTKVNGQKFAAMQRVQRLAWEEIGGTGMLEDGARAHLAYLIEQETGQAAPPDAIARAKVVAHFPTPLESEMYRQALGA